MTFPKYYIHKNPAAHWCIVRTDETKCIHEFPDCSDEHRAWGPSHDDMVADGAWMEVSRECADARKNGFQHAEQHVNDVGDWVEITDPEHVIRDCDQLTAAANVKDGQSAGEWAGCCGAADLGSVWSRVRESKDMRVRCLRKDALTNVQKLVNALVSSLQSQERDEAEAKKSEQKPLRWVENCKPDKPGIWAGLDANGETYITLVDQSNMAARSARWLCKAACYIGPLPEILPPAKKVTERLWLKRAVAIPGLFSSYEECWLTEGITRDGWILTDEIREVER